jgi:hypothetical protein
MQQERAPVSPDQALLQRTPADPGALVEQVRERSLAFLELHRTPDGRFADGAFALHRGQAAYDLYGAIDAVYVLYTLGALGEHTDRAGRAIWAERILACQDERGWFSRRNHRGHSREHATAYAIGALRLLEVEADERYVARIRPIEDLRPILTDHQAFVRWIDRLGFNYLPQDVLRKNVGWNHIWRSSHIGGGVAAMVTIAREQVAQWWGGAVDLERWYGWYFAWLDAEASAQSGLWQRALWNLVYRKPTLIDMGGAVHFFWVYAAHNRRFPYPEPVINATIGLQRTSGLYKAHPFCIDLDGNFCIVRSYLQLDSQQRERHDPAVAQALEANFMAVLEHLLARPYTDIYNDSHGLPGALAALIECAQYPGFRYRAALAGWRHPLDVVCWL